jgi:hypothetical protein
MRLIRYGDASERSGAAMDLSAGAPGWTAAAVITALIHALDDALRSPDRQVRDGKLRDAAKGALDAIERQ